MQTYLLHFARIDDENDIIHCNRSLRNICRKDNLPQTGRGRLEDLLLIHRAHLRVQLEHLQILAQGLKLVPKQKINKFSR